MQITAEMRAAIDEERAKTNQWMATANRLRDELEAAQRDAATYCHLFGGAQAKCDTLTARIMKVIALTDTGSDTFKAEFDLIPSGWRVVEKIRETILGV